MLAGAAAAVASAVAIGVAVHERSGDERPPLVAPGTVETGQAQAEPGTSTVLNLSAGGLSNHAATCPKVDSTLIGRDPIAFKGIVTAHRQGVVEFEVEQAYAGVSAKSVKLTAAQSVDYWLGPVHWEVGSHYLVTAAAGVVNFCGETGKAAPELQAVFDQAFGS
jgi:hypothetical protein